MSDQTQKPVQPNKPEEAHSISQDAQRKCTALDKLYSVPQAAEIAKNYRAGKIDYDAFVEIYEVLINPNLMQKDSYKRFSKCLAKGKFPNRGRFAPALLRALKGGEKEREYAEKLFLELSSDAAPDLTPRQEKAHLKELSELREQDLAANTIATTGSAARAITDIASLRERIDSATETKPENWVIERAPENITKKLDQLQYKQSQLGKVANQKDHEYRLLMANPNADPQLIATLREELYTLDEQIAALAKEIEPVRKEWIDYLTRTLSRYRALEHFSRRAGFDINNTQDLKIWFFDIAAGKSDVKPKTLQMSGLEADPSTGKTKKVLKEIKISRLIFEREKEDIYDYSPGELTIEYYDDEGKLVQTGYKNFLYLVDAFEAYEEIGNLKELNEKIAPETGYKELAPGQKFTAKVYDGLDEKGQKMHHEVSFSIQDINEASGEILLDQSVTKIPKEWLSFSVDPKLYFDRKQEKFTFGEFAKLLRQHSFQREMGIEELEDALKKQDEALNKKCESFVTGETPEQKERFRKMGGFKPTILPVPKEGETKKVYYLDDEGNRQAGILKRAKDDNGKEILMIEPDPSTPNNLPLETMLAAGVPLAMATKRPGLVAKPGTASWQKRVRKLDAVAAMDAANKGSVIENSASSTQPADPSSSSQAAPADNTENLLDNLEQEAKAEEQKPPDAPARKPYAEEVLPYNDVYSVGNMLKTETGLLTSIWNSTRFLSVSDFWEMGKVMWEYYERRFQRRQKDRYSYVGTDIYFFAPEMKRINQSTETEQMQQFKESFDAKGVFEIQDRLINTNNRDEMKACFYTLMEKGQIPWYNVDLWKNINRFVEMQDPSLMIPIPADGNPFTELSETDHRTGRDFLKAAIDKLFGEGQYNEWYSGDKSKYQSNARGYYEEGKELEGTDGGHEQRLGELLRQHKNGEYVDPQEYEGLILHSIENGKSSMQAKIYYMVEGVAAVCTKNGRTILPPDRIAHINSEMLPRFPILEYMTARMVREGGDGKKKRPTQKDYKKWADIFDEGDSSDPEHCHPGPAVDQFMWRYVIPSDPTRTRINKAIRNGENLDHDDMFAYLPPATEEVITDACKATTGSKKFLTLEGYANVFPGFSQYMRTLAEDGKAQRLVEALRSYVRFESIMTEKYEKGKDKYQRMSDLTLRAKKGTVCTPGRPPQVFIDGMNELVDRVVEAYDDPTLNELYATMHIVADETDHRAQEKIKKAFDLFGKTLHKVVKSDNAAKVLALTRAANLEGMPDYTSSADKAARMRDFSSEEDLG